MTEPPGEPLRFVEEFRRQMQELSERIEDLEETIEGDERGRWRGLRDELRDVREEQRRHARLLEAWERDQEVREAIEQRRKRFTTISVSALSVIATILSILVAASTLAGSGLLPGAP